MPSTVFPASFTSLHVTSMSSICVYLEQMAMRKKNDPLTFEGTMYTLPLSFISFNSVSLSSFDPCEKQTRKPSLLADFCIFFPLDFCCNSGGGTRSDLSSPSPKPVSFTQPRYPPISLLIYCRVVSRSPKSPLIFFRFFRPLLP